MGKMYFYDLHPAEGREAFKTEAFETFARREHFRDLENIIQTRDRRLIWVSTYGIPFLDSNGNLAGYRGSDTDITERKRAEEEKRSLEERLMRAEKMEAMGVLAGGVAHDLNNVLGVTVGYSELLLNWEDKSSAIRPQLEAIMKGGQRAAAIVQDLLTLA
jgi:signal transduction histidine kinase